MKDVEKFTCALWLHFSFFTTFAMLNILFRKNRKECNIGTFSWYITAGRA